MPFATMWTAILISNKHPDISHLHNQHVEAHFHVTKHTVLDGKEDLPIGRVVRRLQHYSRSLTKQIRFGVMKKKGSTPKPECPRTETNIPSPTDPTVEEQWRKGSKTQKGQRRTHFEGIIKKKKT